MKKHLWVLLFLSSCLSISAQTRGLVKGETIMFYPVCDDLKNQYTGYDCFYDTNKAYHNHKFNEKEKNRFATDENKLTPFKEIEDHYFYVDNTQKYSKNGKLKNEAYIAFLTRDDGAKMILRVLFQPDKNTNAITQGMLVKFYSGGKMTTGVSLPYITKSAWENSHALKGTKLVRTSNDNYYLGKDIKYLRNGKTTKGYILDLVAENANRLKGNNVDPNRIFLNGSVIGVNNILFKNVANYAFQQPFACVDFYDSTVFLPLSDFYGNGPSTLQMGYNILNYFCDYNQKYNELVADLPPVHSEFYKGLEVYYGRKTMFIEGDDAAHFTGIGNSNIPYILKPGYYTFEKFDFDFDKKKLKLSVYLKDSVGTEFAVTAKNYDKLTYEGYARSFFEAFYRKSDIITKDSLAAVKRDAEENLRKLLKEAEDQEIASVSKKYGSKIAHYYRNLSADDREKFNKAASRWGASTAKDIVDGYVRIGWNKDKCRMSWGEPRDINTTIGAWGREEQWCYYDSYLYFENGKLTSIQN